MDKTDRLLVEFHNIPVQGESEGSDWIVALDPRSELPHSVELLLLRQYCRYVIKRVYLPSCAALILGRRRTCVLGEINLAYESLHNTTIFLKSNGFWYYRKRTWSTAFSPDADRLNLPELLDRVETYNHAPAAGWAEWKKGHLDLLEEAVSGRD